MARMCTISYAVEWKNDPSKSNTKPTTFKSPAPGDSWLYSPLTQVSALHKASLELRERSSSGDRAARVFTSSALLPLLGPIRPLPSSRVPGAAAAPAALPH